MAFRRQKTIGEHLVRAKLHPLPRAGMTTRGQRPGFYKCRRFGGTGCVMCHYVTPSTTHTASATGEVFPITSVITCTTKSVIYDLWCHRCRNSVPANPGADHYVARTEGTAASRFNNHKSDINTGKLKAVSEHFKQSGHKLSDLRYLPFEGVHSNDPTVLASRESYWIQNKRTFQFGINRQK